MTVSRSFTLSTQEEIFLGLVFFFASPYSHPTLKQTFRVKGNTIFPWRSVRSGQQTGRVRPVRQDGWRGRPIERCLMLWLTGGLVKEAAVTVNHDPSVLVPSQ